MTSTLRTASRLQARLLPQIQPRIPSSAHATRFAPSYHLLLARNVSTDVKMRTSEGAKNRSSVSEVIKQDHRELEMYYKQIVSSSDPDVQTRYQNLFVWELARHSISEELVVYPQFEELLKNGKNIADEDRAQHQKLKEKLYIFQDLRATSPDFLPTLESLYADLARHIEEEENDDLPKLEEALPDIHSRNLADSFERTKKFAPTRSHPNVPADKPLFETAAGLMAAPIDKLADLFRKFPKDSHMNTDQEVM